MDKTKILVDDNPAITKGLSIRLRANGYEVWFAEDDISITAAPVTERPDLVLLDPGLPAGDGFVVMERLRKNDRLSNLPVIVLTGRELSGNRDRALRAGATAFFQKPVEDGALLFAIRKALDVFRGALRFDE
ncbi:MAG TPA: response regulator [Candidatus Polarisedimenticolia bacterium]|nr:response regulator [Candidatus Polarisedimenticolia bacterium]